MQHAPNLQSLLGVIQATDKFFNWLKKDGDQLIAAAGLLGGPVWENRATALFDASQEHCCSQNVLDELVALRALLMLDLVNDINSAEAQRFASIHPDDPRADAARLCAEALDEGVCALQALHLLGLAKWRRVV